MTNEKICTLLAEASRAMGAIPRAIVELTKDKSFELFDKENIEDEEAILDLPIGYMVNKYNDYVQGAIWKVSGNDVTLFLTGDEYGQLWETTVDELSFDNQVELLAIIGRSL